MKHFAVPVESSRVREHLQEGCSECRELAEWTSRLVRCCAKMAATKMPESVVGPARALFAARSVERRRTGLRLPASLVFDRYLTPAPAGIRSTRSLFSNYGTPLVSPAAAGEGDVTVYPGSHYGQAWGTSFSTPLVAGGAALRLEQRDSPDASRAAAALAHAKYIGQELGAGELDLFQAVLVVGKKD